MMKPRNLLFLSLLIVAGASLFEERAQDAGKPKYNVSLIGLTAFSSPGVSQENAPRWPMFRE